jgi:peroxiredoxin (alkyl hydroperoxide reductase subunit C)
MKKNILLSAILFLSVTMIWAQQKNHVNMPMLGDDAPSFQAETSNGPLNFPDDYPLRWKILFSHPADFTPVCTSEILELAASQKEFAKLGTEIVVVSTDKLENHLEWKKNIETIRYKDRAPSKIEFPLVSDPNLVVAGEYGMIHPNNSSTKDVRGVFIIDPNNKIRAMFFYPMAIGRNLGEIERTLVALQTSDKQHVLTPANWQPGGDVLIPYNKSNTEAEKMASPDNDDYYNLTWYMRFKKGSK